MIITRDDLTGKAEGTNGWGIITYSIGLVERYLPGEYDYRANDCEGAFLATLCLYLLSGENNPGSFFAEEQDLIFLNHFVFHNIAKDQFLSEMEKYKTDQEKVKAILGLIDSVIRLKKDRFHDFYINAYRQCGFESEQQRMVYCQQLLTLSRQCKAWQGLLDWNAFSRLCTQYNISLPSQSAPIGEPNNAGEPKTEEPKTAEPKPKVFDKEHLSALKSLLSDYMDNRRKVCASNGTTKEYFCCMFRFFQKSYTQKSHAVSALEQALGGENRDLSIHLSRLRDGRLGKQLRGFIKKGHADDIVGKPVNTIREFVAALQEKNAAVARPQAHIKKLP